MNEMNIVSVSSVLHRIKYTLEQTIDLESIWIQGEVSNLTKHRSGHYYFSLKDENGAMSCVMFKSYVHHLQFDVEEGMKVLVKVNVSVYPVRGSLQLYVKEMKPDGIGALFLEFEQRKNRLLKQGYFDDAHKKPKPDYIGNIAIITAKEGAAIHDVISTIRKRWPMMHMHLYPALVQGQKAAESIIAQLLKADDLEYDAILIVRGGGSFEDLFCFNDEGLVKTIYQCKTYTVSGVGHEVDTTLCDLVADHRAVTPTAAAQWVSLDQREVLIHIRDIQKQLEQKMRMTLHNQKVHLHSLASNRYLKDPNTWIIDKRLLLDSLENQLEQNKTDILHTASDIEYKKEIMAASLQQKLKQERLSYKNEIDQLQTGMMNYKNIKETEFLHIEAQLDRTIHLYEDNTKKKLRKQIALLEAYSPLKVLTRGYSITSNEKGIVRSIDDVKQDDHIQIRVQDGLITSKVIQVQEEENGTEKDEISRSNESIG